MRRERLSNWQLWGPLYTFKYGSSVRMQDLGLPSKHSTTEHTQPFLVYVTWLVSLCSPGHASASRGLRLHECVPIPSFQRDWWDRRLSCGSCVSVNFILMHTAALEIEVLQMTYLHSHKPWLCLRSKGADELKVRVTGAPAWPWPFRWTMRPLWKVYRMLRWASKDPLAGIWYCHGKT